MIKLKHLGSPWWRWRRYWNRSKISEHQTRKQKSRSTTVIHSTCKRYKYEKWPRLASWGIVLPSNTKSIEISFHGCLEQHVAMLNSTWENYPPEIAMFETRYCTFSKHSKPLFLVSMLDFGGVSLFFAVFVVHSRLLLLFPSRCRFSWLLALMSKKSKGRIIPCFW